MEMAATKKMKDIVDLDRINIVIIITFSLIIGNR